MAGKETSSGMLPGDFIAQAAAQGPGMPLWKAFGTALVLVAPLVVLSVFAMAFGVTSAHPHDFWINHGAYKSKDGVHCCGEGDCAEIPPDQVRASPRGYELMNGELVPFSESQPSEDGKYWRCKRYDGTRRCFFAPQPSS